MPGTVYDAEFYDANEVGSYRSARIVLGLVCPLLRPASVLDVGCGVGTWLRAARDHGAGELLGIDGSYVDTARFHVEAASFRPADVSDGEALLAAIGGRRFDMAMCMETAEHVPTRAARGLVDALARSSDVVLWSAAVPGQGGTEHVNERHLPYWASLWFERGFEPVDVLRNGLQFRQFEVWYAQNAILFVKADRARAVRATFEDAYRAHFGYVPPLGFFHPESMAPFKGRPAAEVNAALDTFVGGFHGALAEALDVPRDAFQRDDHRHGDALTLVSLSSGRARVNPCILVRSPEGMTITAGLYYPLWAADGLDVAAIRRGVEAAGLTWDGPFSRALDGWAELTLPDCLARLSMSLIEQPLDPSAIVEMAADMARIWASYAGSSAAQDAA